MVGNLDKQARNKLNWGRAFSRLLFPICIVYFYSKEKVLEMYKIKIIF
jgi:hypothetical protein